MKSKKSLPLVRSLRAPLLRRSARRPVSPLLRTFSVRRSYLLRDRDGVYGADFTKRVAALGITEKLIAPHAPWQNPHAERLIGTIRRECLDQSVILGERQLRAVLQEYFE